MDTIYDNIGHNYSVTRMPDPRIAEKIGAALGDSMSVVNVGAGVGSYESRDRLVVSVEPSLTMIGQRTVSPAHVVQGTAEALPLIDNAVDAALAILTIHHWTDPAKGLAEMRRVARRRVILFTWDQEVWEWFWLIREYFSMHHLDRTRAVAVSDIVAALGGGQIITVLIPHDCVDGFQGAYWRRPGAYFDPRVRSGISTFALMPPDDLNNGLRKLGADIHSGFWAHRHHDLLEQHEIDLGYRLVVVEYDIENN